MATVIKVDKRGVGAEVGMRKGDKLIAFNSKPMIDILDYYFYDKEESFAITVERKGKPHIIEIEKDEWESLGLDFGEDSEIQPIRCKNKCKFCFVDQLPKGMRSTMYVKDDDYRLSFISGNYITLTNVDEEELQRIERLKLSPMYISVHATDPAIKTELVCNPQGGKTFGKMQRLSAAGIVMHAQVVMCNGINDGNVLAKTLIDLNGLETLKTVAVVPVGLSGHRQNLAELKEITQEVARNAIDIINGANNTAGKMFAYASDEMYLKANLPMPNYEHYGNFEQIENGVGLVTTFAKEVEDELAEKQPNIKVINISCITGQSFAPILKGQIDTIKATYKGLTANVMAIDNDFFGRSITVAGLITGQDIIAQAKGKCASDIIIPSNMLREFTDTLLDGLTIKDLSRELGGELHICDGGGALVNIIDDLARRQ